MSTIKIELQLFVPGGLTADKLTAIKNMVHSLRITSEGVLHRHGIEVVLATVVKEQTNSRRDHGKGNDGEAG